ncbi:MULTISPECIES: glycosyl hydrolase [unclassified Cryobacterium]|uniref:glycosyl hydrolase n=1 Tax=unclassified Cryobacterium TaxID=2649013 RepID=UPI00106D703A|nr:MULTISPECIES: glycosyl hydrolase [unclassified Cryobacterium]TFC57657.1 1,3-beta-glucanase [Cryobacterium sp. TMB1-7]TFC85902.1 1,3-beta-glucanase [Cryobacterium sp. TMT4-31]
MIVQRTPRILAVATCLVIAAALTACTTTDAVEPVDTEASTPGAAIFPGNEVAPLVDALPQQSLKALPTARLSDGLIPPTNRWFSGLVFGEESMPVFPLPLSFQLSDSGFGFGLPEVSADTNVIRGGFAGQIGVQVGDGDGLEQAVTAYDEASVTIGQSIDGATVGSTVIAEGSPFVSFAAAADVALTMPTAFSEAEKGVWSVDVAGSTYGMVSAGTLSSGTDLSLTAGQSVTWFALPDSGTLTAFAEAARHPVIGTSVEYGAGTDTATTTIHYDTGDGGDTLIAALPHQAQGLADGASCTAGEYPSIYGALTVCEGRQLSWSVPAVAPSGALDLSALGDEDRAALADQVRADVAATTTFAADTYFGGKSLYRAANLLEVARQVGADDAVATLTDRLSTALDDWTDPDACAQRTERCFVYDPDAKGIVGLATSFGSEEFNDHHFHYGYFFYAAAVVAADDPEAAQRWAPVLNLLAADLATSGGSEYFPDRRVFDAYAGHSWASGTSPFGDGNNQESSSEAVTAWNGLALWAAASDQADLAAEAEWMLSSEAASSRAYWTDFDLDDPVYAGFDHTVTSLVWGGKRDYATWFSAEPSAMLGILVLPMSPVAGYLGGDPDRVSANLADALPEGNYDVMFGDYLLMYAGLRGPEAASDALTAAASLPEERIDDGNSRAYLMAWLMRWRTPPAG